MFHTHPVLLQTMHDDRYRRIREPHHVPAGLTDVTRPSTVRAIRRGLRHHQG
jgi:hypothetical protein